MDLHWYLFPVHSFTNVPINYLIEEIQLERKLIKGYLNFSLV